MIPSGADSFLKWFPPVVAIIQLVLLPLLIIALYYVIDARISVHNANLYAHPALNDLKELEKKIAELSVAVEQLKISIERLTPRRHTDVGHHET